MFSPIFLNDAQTGILKEFDFSFSKNVYVYTPDGNNNNLLSSVDLKDSILLVDHSDDPIKEPDFERLHYSKLLADIDKLIVISPSPDQLFYQIQGPHDYVTFNKKTRSSRKFKHIFCNGHWAKVKNRYNLKHSFNKDIEKYFLCLSREDKIHRRLLNYSLHKHGLFNSGLISHQRAPSGFPFSLDKELSIFSSKESFDSVMYKKFALAKHFVDGLVDDTKVVGKEQTAYSFDAYAKLNNKVLFDLVVESDFGDFLFITEKLIKPIIFKTPFVVLGCPHTLKYLRYLGFKTFDCVFDESYDEEFLLYNRVEKLVSSVKAVCSLPLQQCSEYFKITEEICEFNYNHFMNSDWSFNLQDTIQYQIDEVLNV